MHKNISFWRSASNIFCNVSVAPYFGILPIKCTPFNCMGCIVLIHKKSLVQMVGFPSGTLIYYVRVFIVWTPDHQVCNVDWSICFVNYDIVFDNIFVVGDVFLLLIRGTTWYMQCFVDIVTSPGFTTYLWDGRIVFCTHQRRRTVKTRIYLHGEFKVC